MSRKTMRSRKKHTVLNIQQRLDILRDLEDTSMTAAKIGKMYGVDPKTVHRIKKNAIKINAYLVKYKQEKNRRRIKEPLYEELEKRLLEWFEERKTRHEHVSDALLLEKATEMKHHIPSCVRSKVSRGWLAKFKKRNGIRLSHKQNEVRADADQDGAVAFINDFKKLIREEDISLENVYNMDESGLVWKALPTKKTDGDKEINIEGYKHRKDRVTLALCANALGTHKMPPIVIYKYKNPRALKHEVSLPVIFKSQINGWMNRPIFLDWLENHFKPSVLEYQNQRQISGKVILLLTNRDAHKVPSEKQNDEDFQVIYLPANTASLIQPMSHGIVEKTKTIYRHRILQRVLTYDGGVDEFYKDYTLKNCIDILYKSWSEVTPNDIRNAWNKIIGLDSPSNYTLPTAILQPDWTGMISVIKGEECTQEHVTEFLSNCEKEEQNIEEEQVETGTFNEEPREEPQEMIYPRLNDENDSNELHKIFERLTFYGTTAPTCIQYMIQGLKTYFLGKEH